MKPNLPKLTRHAAQVLLIASVFLVINPFVIVPAGSKGLVFTFGKLNGHVAEPGLAFRVPLAQNVKLVTIRPIQLDHTVEVGPQGAISKDNQTIGANLVVFYKYKSDDLVNMWNKYGEDRIKSIVTQSMVESFKSEIGQHHIFEIPLQQNTIRTQTFTSLKDKISAYPVEVTELKVVNYDWSDEFDKQIQETMHRAQQVKQKEQELLITEQEAQKKVKTAEADKQALITTAEGERAAALLRAEAKAAEGDGIKKYNQAVQANMELELQIRKLEIEKIKAEKWNGQYVSVNNYGPIPVQTGALQPQ
jgi:regulator of protease activity HflC (stomatin/prohibitin superfamily)